MIGRDVLIIAVAGAINMMTGFRGFKPSWLGKASTFVQVSGVILILIAAVFPGPERDLPSHRLHDRRCVCRVLGCPLCILRGPVDEGR